MAAFNDTVPDMRGVHYASYVGWVSGGVRDVHTLLAPGFTYLSRRTGDNDGMVPAASQRWGEVLGDVNADHWADRLVARAGREELLRGDRAGAGAVRAVMNGETRKPPATAWAALVFAWTD